MLSWTKHKSNGLIEETAWDGGKHFAVVHHETGFPWWVDFWGVQSARGVKCRTRQQAKALVEKHFLETQEAKK